MLFLSPNWKYNIYDWKTIQKLFFVCICEALKGLYKSLFPSKKLVPKFVSRSFLDTWPFTFFVRPSDFLYENYSFCLYISGPFCLSIYASAGRWSYLFYFYIAKIGFKYLLTCSAYKITFFCNFANFLHNLQIP